MSDHKEKGLEAIRPDTVEVPREEYIKILKIISGLKRVMEESLK
jgi:hypothetical protein